MALLALWNPNIQFLKTDGTINAGGKIVVTDHNDAESIPANYSDADGTTLNASPIVLDALGRATCYIDDGRIYDLYVKDANGATLWTVPGMTTGSETIVVSNGFSVSSNDSSVAVVISVDQNGVTNYDLSIQNEIDRATEAEKGLSDAIESEKNRAEEAESTLSGSIAGETERAVAAEKASRTEIVAGYNITVEKTVGADGQDVYTVSGEREDNLVDDVRVNGASVVTDNVANIDVPVAGTASPLMDGKASVGNSLKYAREDHVHPTDTSRASASHTHGSITNDGKIGTTANLPVITSTGGAVTTGSFSTTTSAVRTSSAAGTANTYSRGDHVHSISLATGDRDGQVKIAGSNVSVAGWGNKASQFSLGSTASSRVYTMFARMSDENPYDDGEAQVILSSAGNYGSTNQGTWEIIVSNRGSTASSPKAYMIVRCINAVKAIPGTVTEPTFGYYIDTTNHYIYFGIYSPQYRGNSRITVLVSSKATLQDFGDSTTAPTGWTAVTPIGVSSAVKLDTARAIQIDLASTSSASFDGTANITPGVTGTLPVTNGGTGIIASSTTELTSTLINALEIEESVPVDTDYFISQYVNGGNKNTTYYRRPVAAIWNYIKGKISSVLGLTASAYSGKAATAGTADKAVADNSGNNIMNTYATKTELNAKGLTVKEISGEQVICFE